MKNIFIALTVLTTIHTTNLIYGKDIDLDQILNTTLANGKKLGEGSFGIV